MYNFNQFAIELNEPEQGVAPTDSRLRPDQRLMELGRWDEANTEKERLEVKQRRKRRAWDLFEAGGKFTFLFTYNFKSSLYLHANINLCLYSPNARRASRSRVWTALHSSLVLLHSRYLLRRRLSWIQWDILDGEGEAGLVKVSRHLLVFRLPSALAVINQVSSCMTSYSFSLSLSPSPLNACFFLTSIFAKLSGLVSVLLTLIIPTQPLLMRRTRRHDFSLYQSSPFPFPLFFRLS